jgi:O-antigen ligase
LSQPLLNSAHPSACAQSPAPESVPSESASSESAYREPVRWQSADRPSANPEPAAPAFAETSGGPYLLGIWILLAVLTPLVGFLGARGLAPSVGFAGLLCVPLVRPRKSDAIGLFLFALLAAWALVSAAWSPAPAPHDFKSLTRFTGLHLAQELVFSGALIMSARRFPPNLARQALTWVGVGLIALAAVLIAESFTGAAMFRALQPVVGKTVPADWALRSVGQGVYVLAVMFWPATVGLWTGGRPYVAAGFAAGAIVALGLMGISAPAMALAASAAVFGLVYRLGRPAATAGMVLAAAQALILPWILGGLGSGGLFHAIGGRLPASWAARVDIWTFTSARMSEKPWLGWGLDASRTFTDRIPLHPHDAALQLWFELGAMGAALGAVIWAFIFRRFAKAAPGRPLFAAAGCATATSVLVIGALSFSVWQEWWICLMALGFAACAVLGRQLDGDTRG